MTKEREEAYKGAAWLVVIVGVIFCVWYANKGSVSPAEAANRKWANEILRRPDGTVQNYTWRDRNGNATMRGKFTPDKPGSKTGKLELRDSNGNRQGSINVR